MAQRRRSSRGRHSARRLDTACGDPVAAPHVDIALALAAPRSPLKSRSTGSSVTEATTTARKSCVFFAAPRKRRPPSADDKPRPTGLAGATTTAHSTTAPPPIRLSVSLYGPTGTLSWRFSSLPFPRLGPSLPLHHHRPGGQARRLPHARLFIFLYSFPSESLNAHLVVVLWATSSHEKIEGRGRDSCYSSGLLATLQRKLSSRYAAGAGALGCCNWIQPSII